MSLSNHGETSRACDSWYKVGYSSIYKFVKHFRGIAYIHIVHVSSYQSFICNFEFVCIARQLKTATERLIIPIAVLIV